ncbi:hypothetical protein HYC85_029013 [Camellia sinensis]|uniref:Uncharacterized protein n=1 Tax=Camellia sinensis TaxID=4442 RepID=A0A7J7FWW8_CAMSI|nr:hypothetical protein HYC85_029013 [Camellia sinensis]
MPHLGLDVPHLGLMSYHSETRSLGCKGNISAQIIHISALREGYHTPSVGNFLRHTKPCPPSSSNHPPWQNNDDVPLSTIDGITPESVRGRDGLPVVPAMAGLKTTPRRLPRDVRDKRTRSTDHSRSPDGHRHRRESHTYRLEHKLRDQDAIIRRMAAEMKALKRQVKGKGVAGVGDHSERTQPRRSEDRRDVLEERVRRREAQRVPALQQLSCEGGDTEEVVMPPPRLAALAPLDRDLARLSITPFSLETETTLLPAGFHQPKFTLYDGKIDP